jgi:transcriptional regulator with XRE-family HTH domain
MHRLTGNRAPLHVAFLRHMGREIFATRKRAGLTQSQVGDRCSALPVEAIARTGHSAFRKIETGSRDMTLWEWLQLADTLGMDASEVMNRAYAAARDELASD